MSSPILVTGASGFIAKHVVAELIRQGHAVRGTVRDSRRGDAIRYALERAGADPARLSLVTADLTADDGWAAAVDGIERVQHVASPFPLSPSSNRDGLVRIARDGTLRVLRAATAAGVARVVVTSSMAACIYPSGGNEARTYTEADWTDTTRRDISAYVVSKTLAERAAWDFVRTTAGAPELVVLNPGFVQGPALDADLSGSHELLRQMANGRYPATPRVGYAIVDVRDLAVAHVVAAQHPAAAGERFLIANGYLTLFEIGRLIAAALPDTAWWVPLVEVPDALARAAALLDGRVRTVLPELSTRRLVDASKARSRLGLSLRPAQEAVTAAALSLRALRVI